MQFLLVHYWTIIADRIVESLRLSTPPEELVQHVARIKCLWETSEIQQAYENRNSFQLAESTWYFLSKVEAIFQDDYLPTNQDIVQTRVKTTGIIEHEFEISDGDGRKRKLIMVFTTSRKRRLTMLDVDQQSKKNIADRCWRSEEREEEVDSLLPGRVAHHVPDCCE